MKTTQEKLNEAKNELIAWLNDECPKCFPPLEPYTTFDLTHDFCNGLRNRLDNIIILKGELYESSELKSRLKDESWDKCEYCSESIPCNLECEPKNDKERNEIMEKYGITEDMVDDYMKQFPKQGEPKEVRTAKEILSKHYSKILPNHSKYRIAKDIINAIQEYHSQFQQQQPEITDEEISAKLDSMNFKTLKEREDAYDLLEWYCSELQNRIVK